MFWDSVQEGLKALTFWETYLAAFVHIMHFYLSE